LFASVKTTSRRLEVVSIFICAILLFATRFQRNYFHYSINLWPCFILIFIRFADTFKVKSLSYLTVSLVLFYLGIVVHQFPYPYYHTLSPLRELYYPVAFELQSKIPEGSKYANLTGERILDYLSDRVDYDFYKDYNKPVCIMTNNGKNCSMLHEIITKDKKFVMYMEIPNDRSNKDEIKLVQEKLENENFKVIFSRTGWDGRVLRLCQRSP